MRQEGDSNGRIAGHRNGRRWRAKDECVNNPNGIRDGGSESDTAMDDLKPGAQPWASSFFHIPKVLEWV